MTIHAHSGPTQADLNAALDAIAPLTAAERKLATTLFARGVSPGEIVATIAHDRMVAVAAQAVDDDPGASSIESPRMRCRQR